MLQQALADEPDVSCYSIMEFKGLIQTTKGLKRTKRSCLNHFPPVFTRKKSFVVIFRSHYYFRIVKKKRIHVFFFSVLRTTLQISCFTFAPGLLENGFDKEADNIGGKGECARELNSEVQILALHFLATYESVEQVISPCKGEHT